MSFVIRQFLRRTAATAAGTPNLNLLLFNTASNSSRNFQVFHNFCTFTRVWTDGEYERRSEETLSALSDYLDLLPERVDTDPAYDVSYSMGVITAHLGPCHGTYVINKQSPNKQIWLSSPVSGPKRYDLSDAGRWIYKHDGQTLHELLERELRTIFKTEAITLTTLP